MGQVWVNYRWRKPCIAVLLACGLLTAAVHSASGSSARVPPPQFGRNVVAAPVKGRVVVALPGRRSQRLTRSERIPVGSIVDARTGTVRLTSAQPNATTKSGTFTGGTFRIIQRRSERGLTDLALTGGDFGVCRGAQATRSLPGRTIRHLRGVAHGGYRTVGHNAAATVRGTVWETRDECDGTRVRDVEGEVDAHSQLETVTLRRGEDQVVYCHVIDVQRLLRFCTAVLSKPTQQIVAFGVALKLAQPVSTYDVCVQDPHHVSRCRTFPIAPSPNNDFEIGGAACLQDDGPGQYIATFRVAGQPLGIPIAFTMTRPHPPFTFPCVSQAGGTA